MTELLDIDGVSAEEWADEYFEFSYCDQCGGDAQDHDYILFMGHWFARCKDENFTNKEMMERVKDG